MGKLILSPNIIVQQTKDGLCILHVSRGECHILNSSAAFIIECIEKSEDGITSEDLAQIVSEEYGISYDNALSDVNVFLSEAQENDFIADNT